MTAINQFKEAMMAAGFDAGHIIDDGKIHPVKCPCDKVNNKSGRYYIHSDGAANGAFGCFHRSDNALENEWQSTEPQPIMTAADRAQHTQKIELAKAERAAQTQAEQAKAANEAQTTWHRARPANDDHPYLQRKGVKAHDARTIGNVIYLPIFDGKNRLCNLQSIDHHGVKRFQLGGKTKGCYGLINGDQANKTAVIVEGWATGASVAQATGYTVIIAFNAGNLLPVAKRIAQDLPNDWTLIVAGDNDQHKPDNVGKSKAEAAARAVGARCVVPSFDSCEQSTQPTDWNDLHQLAGLHEVKRQIDAAGYLMDKGKDQTDDAPAIIDDAPTAETDEQAIERLARLTALELARVIKDEAKRLGVAISDLRRLIKEVQNAQAIEGGNGKPPLFDEVEPWDSPVNGDQLLNDVYAQLKAHVIADDSTLHLATLWVCMTWLVDSASVLPIALITAPERNCGKSTLLIAMSKMAKKAQVTANMSSAVLFRLLDRHQPTMFIDEVDTWLKDNEELRGILNAGHTRDAAYVYRCEGDNFDPVRFSVWGAKAVSGISANNISDTLLSRSIVLPMRRKLKGENALNIRHTTESTFTDIKRKLARWADDVGGQFSSLSPLMDGLNNRDQDNIEPLLSIALLAGGEWVARLEHAVRVNCAEKDDNPSIGVELLQACHDMFDHLKVEKVHTSQMIEFLLRDDDASFNTYNRGKPITARQVARKLADYSIRPKGQRIGYDVRKGYSIDQFNEAFNVYLSGEESNKENKIMINLESVTDNTTCNVTHNLSVTREAAPVLACNVVSDKNRENEEKNYFNAKRKNTITFGTVGGDKNG